jgi:hypothetical protein
VTWPSTSCGWRIGGSFAASRPNRPIIACDHWPVAGFIRKLQEASPTSIARSPVSRILM